MSNKFGLVSISDSNGRPAAAICVGDQVLACALVPSLAAYPTIDAILADWDAAMPLFQAVADEIVDLMAAGLKGFEISTAVGPLELSDGSLDLVWQTAEETGAVVFIHPLGTSLGKRLNRDYLSNTIGQPAETTIALSHMIFAGVFDRYPNLKVLAAHGGGYLPHYIGRSDHAWSVRPEIASFANLPSSYLRKIWFDTVLFDDKYLGYLIENIGADRVAFGTDYAFDMGDYDVDRLAKSIGDDDTRGAVMGGTAASLLNL